MKKALSLILALLLIVSLTSCNQDKSAEVISTMEEFSDACIICDTLKDTFVGNLTSTAAEADGSHKITSINAQSYWNYLKEVYVDNSTTDDIHGIQGNTPSGSISGTEKEFTLKNVKMSSSFTLELDDKQVGGDYSDEFTLNGSYSYEEKQIEDSSAEMLDRIVSYNFTVNDKQYNLSYTIRDGKDNKGDFVYYTAASINGKEVNLALLNAERMNSAAM